MIVFCYFIRPSTMFRTIVVKAKQVLIRIEYRIKQSSLFSVRTEHKRLFYPGCSLVGGDPNLVGEVFRFLRTRYPDVGIWTSCCGMPLEKYISPDAARKATADILPVIEKEGITEVITSCGNCFNSLNSMLQGTGCSVVSLYDTLCRFDWPSQAAHGTFIVHHPCPARNENTFRRSFVSLAEKCGIRIENLYYCSNPLACCLSKTVSANERRRAIKDKQVITYCAHCVKKFQSTFGTTHILQLLFNRPEPIRKTNKVRTFFNYAFFRCRLYPAHDNPIHPGNGASIKT